MIGDLDILLPSPAGPGDSWRWGTVTQVSPLRIRLDGDAAALDTTPDTLASVTLGERVWCQIVRRRVVVHGVSAGLTPPGIWAAYTCTVSGLTMGASTVDASHSRIGDTVNATIQLVLGAGFSFTAAAAFSLPVSAFAGLGMATGYMSDAGFGTFLALPVFTGSSLYVFGVDPSTNQAENITNTSPFTWAAGDQITLALTYRAAP